MILLTADRPPELRRTGANQTIDQVGFFGGHVRWFFDMPAPDDAIDPCFVLTTIDQAIHRSKTGGGSPVHINCMFREPLAPDPESFRAPASPALDSWTGSKEPFTRYAKTGLTLATVDRERLARSLSGAKRPLCILGRLQNEAVTEDVVEWADKVGVPVLPDIVSQRRLGQRAPGRRVRSIIGHYDLLLSSRDFRESVRPDAVIQIGRCPVSKRLAALVSDACPHPYILIASGSERIDPDHRVTHRFALDADGIEHLFSGTDLQADVEQIWTDKWTRANAVSRAWIHERFGTGSDLELSEQGIAYRLSRAIPEGSSLVLGSSMPIRHADTFSAIDGAPVLVASNRGASGIDGTLATAAGLSTGVESRITVLLGDLALLHDLNSLALVGQKSVVVVVINNDGGGIFSYLPIASHTEFFEDYFGTPHGYTFQKAAELFGLGYACPENHADFDGAYGEAHAREGASLIEIRTDRKTNHDTHLRLLADIDCVLGGHGGGESEAR